MNRSNVKIKGRKSIRTNLTHALVVPNRASDVYFTQGEVDGGQGVHVWKRRESPPTQSMAVDFCVLRKLE